MDVNVNNNESPLNLAIHNSEWEIAKLLVEAGGDVNSVDDVGRGPLFYVCNGGNMI